MIRVDSAEHVLQTDILVTDPGPPPRDWMIALCVRYGTDEQTLHVVDCERIVIDRV